MFRTTLFPLFIELISLQSSEPQEHAFRDKEKGRIVQILPFGGAYGARTGQNEAGMQQLQGKEDTPSVSVFKVYSKHITLMGKRESQSAFLFLAILFFLAPI